MELLRSLGFVGNDGKVNGQGFAVLMALLQIAREEEQLFPHDTWLEIMKVGGVGVTVPIELVILSGTDILLTKRSADDPVWPNQLHLPGSYLRQGEKILDACQRIANREIQGITINNWKPVGISNNVNSPRFHDLSILACVQYEGTPQEGEWYSIEQDAPEDTIDEHQAMWSVIQEHLAQR